MTAPVRRSLGSVCSPIAEAWFKRRYPKHFVDTLSDAGSEAADTIVWIGFDQEYDDRNDQTASAIEKKYRQTIGGLVKTTNTPDSWCSPSSEAQEPSLQYDAFALE